MASVDGPSPSPACRGLRSLLLRRRADAPSSDQDPLISSSSPPATGKKKASTFATFCRLGCAFPATRSSADWEGERRQTEKATKKKKKKERRGHKSSLATTVTVPEVWCAALGIPFISSDESMAFAASNRGNTRRGGRHDAERALVEIIFHHRMLLQGGNAYDQYRDWRLDVDNMTYEELLELGDKIGYVSTGLREEDIACNIRKVQHSNFDIHLSPEMERKCSICQEEYALDDELGELGCGHRFHLYCIRNWLFQKNACPICKNAVINI